MSDSTRHQNPLRGAREVRLIGASSSSSAKLSVVARDNARGKGIADVPCTASHPR
jgi:hypothetical protein